LPEPVGPEDADGMASLNGQVEVSHQSFAAPLAEADLAEFPGFLCLLQWQRVRHRLGSALGGEQVEHRSLEAHPGALVVVEGAAQGW